MRVAAATWSLLLLAASMTLLPAVTKGEATINAGVPCGTPTFPSTSSFYYFGRPTFYTLIGEVFKTPDASNVMLHTFTVYPWRVLGTTGTYEVSVYEWDATNKKAVNPMLGTSGPFDITTVSTTNPTENVTTTFSPPVGPLDPAKTYVVFYRYLTGDFRFDFYIVTTPPYQDGYTVASRSTNPLDTWPQGTPNAYDFPFCAIFDLPPPPLTFQQPKRTTFTARAGATVTIKVKLTQADPNAPVLGAILVATASSTDLSLVKSAIVPKDAAFTGTPQVVASAPPKWAWPLNIEGGKVKSRTYTIRVRVNKCATAATPLTLALAATAEGSLAGPTFQINVKAAAHRKGC